MKIASAHRIKDVEEYYFSRKLAEVKKLDTPEHPVINLGIGSPDMPPHQQVVVKLAQTANLPNAHGYQSYRGIPALREAIADFYRRYYQTTLHPVDEVLPLIGSKEGIAHICLAFVDEGDKVLIPNPGYPTYASAAKLAGATLVPYALQEKDGWRIDLNALQEYDFTGVKIMFINSLHMPTGHLSDATELQPLVDLAHRHQFLLVNDNPYSFILNEKPSSILSLPGAKDVALELNSLSKSHNMAGWRLGWVAGKNELIDTVLRVKSNFDSGIFLGLQEAAVEALRLPTEWFAQQNLVYKKRQQLAYRLAHLLGCHTMPNQSGLFLWIKAPDTVIKIETWVDKILYDTRVFITPGFIFGSQGERYVRISLCAAEQQYEEAIARIQTWKNLQK